MPAASYGLSGSRKAIDAVRFHPELPVILDRSVGDRLEESEEPISVRWGQLADEILGGTRAIASHSVNKGARWLAVHDKTIRQPIGRKRHSLALHKRKSSKL